MRCLILLAVVTAALADGASRCSGVDVESLEDTLRHSACALNGTEKHSPTIPYPHYPHPTTPSSSPPSLFSFSLTIKGTAPRSPKFEIFPDSPFNVLLGDQVVLHVELITTTDRVRILWHYNNTTHTSFLFEDPFCDKELEVNSISHSI